MITFKLLLILGPRPCLQFILHNFIVYVFSFARSDLVMIVSCRLSTMTDDEFSCRIQIFFLNTRFQIAVFGRYRWQFIIQMMVVFLWMHYQRRQRLKTITYLRYQTRHLIYFVWKKCRILQKHNPQMIHTWAICSKLPARTFFVK